MLSGIIKSVLFSLILSFSCGASAGDVDEYRVNLVVKAAFESAEKKWSSSTMISGSVIPGIEKLFEIDEYRLKLLLGGVVTDQVEIGLSFLDGDKLPLTSNTFFATLNTDADFSLTSDEVSVEGTIKISEIPKQE